MKADRFYGWQGGEASVRAELRDDGILVLRTGDAEHRYEILSTDAGCVRLRDGDRVITAFAAARDRRAWVQIDGRVHVFERRTKRPRPNGDPANGALGPIESPMIGTVRKVLVAPGAIVEEGQGLVVVEAMKMELTLRAPAAGIVTDVRCHEGGAIDQGSILVVLGPVPAESTEPQ